MIGPDAETGDEFLFKFILVGDAGVGKSSILLKYTSNQFKRDYNVTIGVEFGSKFVQVDPQTRVKLQIWDTAGQESFRAIVRSFYRNAAGVFLVYDVNKRDSFLSLESWLGDIKMNCDPNAILVLMGNQADVGDEREVSYEEGESFMREHQISFFFETSAVDGQNIEKAFEEATKLAFLNYVKDQVASNAKSSILHGGAGEGAKLNGGKTPGAQKKGCC